MKSTLLGAHFPVPSMSRLILAAPSAAAASAARRHFGRLGRLRHDCELADNLRPPHDALVLD